MFPFTEMPPRCSRFCLFASALTAAAQSPNVTAVLTESETAVGRPVQLEIQVTGASNPKPPGEIVVEGLDIRSAGTSRQYQMQNFSVSYSFTYNYTIMPLKAGHVPDPAADVEAGGQSLRTPELTLNVVSSRGQAQLDAPAAVATTATSIRRRLVSSRCCCRNPSPMSAKWSRCRSGSGLNMRAPVESLGSGVQIGGQGFTTQKMTEPRQTVETINGRTYQVFIFKTAIAAARPGKLEIGPAEINPVVRVPRPGQRNRSLPRDLADDPFFNNFFNDPAFAPSMPKEVKLKSDAQFVEVKPLPPNAPPDFAGAVGMFTLKTDVNPKTANAGDPHDGDGVAHRPRQLRSRDGADARGRDRLAQVSAVREFQTGRRRRDQRREDVRDRAEREGRKDKLPPLVFSFFDPVKENYVTLAQRRDPAAHRRRRYRDADRRRRLRPRQLRLLPPAATPTPAAAEGQPEDILAQLDDRRGAGAKLHAALCASFVLDGAASAVRWRWSASSVEVAAGRGQGDREAQRLARLQHEAADLQRRLRANDGTPQQYVADASRAVQLKTALAKNVDPNAVDAETAAAAFRLDESGTRAAATTVRRKRRAAIQRRRKRPRRSLAGEAARDPRTGGEPSRMN